MGFTYFGLFIVKKTKVVEETTRGYSLEIMLACNSMYVIGIFNGYLYDG